MFGFGKKKKEAAAQEASSADVYVAPVTGEYLPLSEVSDPVFSQGVMGDGYAVNPTAGTIVAPVAGTIALIQDTLHAFMLRTENGGEVLVHIGIDTVELGGEGLNGVDHLLGVLLLRPADLRPGGLREPGPAHHPPHGELVAGQGQGLRGGLDTDPLGLEPLQEGRVLVLVLEGEDRGRPTCGPVTTVPGDDGAYGSLVVGGSDGGVRGHLSGGPGRGSPGPARGGDRSHAGRGR